jgi:hypothetical protein
MLFSKEEIQVKIFEYEEKIKYFKHLLKKGSHKPSELRNAIIDYKVEIANLKKMGA